MIPTEFLIGSGFMSGNVDGRVSSGNHETSQAEIKKEQKIYEKFIPNRAGRIAKSFVQLPQTKEIQGVGDVYSPTVVCLVLINSNDEE